MLLLALMSSENRAAASLAQNYPGGKNAFVKAMNAKAHALGMKNTRYVEPTGLSLHNVSTLATSPACWWPAGNIRCSVSGAPLRRRPWPSATPTTPWASATPTT